MKKHIVIFSHGFGTKQDDRGMFPPIVAGLPEVESVLFDYGIIDDAARSITIRPFNEQAEILRDVIEEARRKNPDATIDIIAHSQGCVVVALLCPTDVRKVILTAPSTHLAFERTIARFRERAGTVIDFNGLSTLARADGSCTLVPASYWKERAQADAMKAYENLAKVTDLTIITANQDNILGPTSFPGFKVIPLDGNHGFDGKDMPLLIKTIREILL